MKNYIIGTLAVIIVFLLSVVYKQQNTLILNQFPVQEEMTIDSSETPPLFLFLFFSKKNCASCLDEVIKTLNEIKPPFYVQGIVPGDQLKDEMDLRSKTGAAFPITNFERYRKFIPMYTPTLFGVANSGKIIFIMPGSVMQSGQIENFLVAAYSKTYHLLDNKKGRK